MYSYADIFSPKQRLLFVTAHPDDLVCYFGALIRQLRQDQKEIFVLLVTNGCRGSGGNSISESQLAEQRRAEELACLDILGVTHDHFTCLNYADGEVESDLKLIEQIAHHIRTSKADLVATHNPSLQYAPSADNNGYTVQHRDHRKIGEAVIDAVYPFARDRSFFPEQLRDGVEPREVYDILLTGEDGANFEFEFTAHAEDKKQAMRAHASQFDDAKIEKFFSFFTTNGQISEKFKYLKLLW